jgi:hypothetical protein
MGAILVNGNKASHSISGGRSRFLAGDVALNINMGKNTLSFFKNNPNY